MKMLDFKTIVLTLFTASLLFGCKKDDPVVDTKPVIPVVTVTGISADGLSFLYFEQTSKSFTIESDSPWEITKTDGWFSISPTTGKAGTTEVKVSVSANSDQARNGEFTVTANSGTVSDPCNWTEKYTISQSAYLSAGISIDGLTEDGLIFDADEPKTVTFNLLTTFDWSIELSADGADAVNWLTVSPESGAGAQSVTITITAQVNTESERRECTLTIATSDPLNRINADAKVIAIRQEPHYDFDTNLAAGYVFLSEDFDWVIPIWSPEFSKYGWPTARVGQPENDGYNEIRFQLEPLKPEMDKKGWTYSQEAYARAEGWAKLGATNQMAHITTRAFTEIATGKTVNLLVSFDAAIYATYAGNRDSGTQGAMTVSVEGDGTINSTDDKSINIQMKSHYGFDKYYLIVYNATETTKIKFGSEETVTSRFILDNIKIERTDNIDPTLPETKEVVLPLDYEVKDLTPETAYNEGNVVAEGATLRYLIRVNKAWTATPSENWLRFTQVFCSLSANGGSVNGGAGSATATAMPYNNCLIAVDPNLTANSRTATITIVSGGQTLKTITVTQEVSSNRITLTGITNDKIELIADNPAPVQFTVNATTAWEITTTDSWYQLSTTSGVGNADVNIELTATANNGTQRTGSFTITAGTATKTVIVEQLANKLDDDGKTVGFVYFEDNFDWLARFNGPTDMKNVNDFAAAYLAANGTYTPYPLPSPIPPEMVFPSVAQTFNMYTYAQNGFEAGDLRDEFIAQGYTDINEAGRTVYFAYDNLKFGMSAKQSGIQRTIPNTAQDKVTNILFSFDATPCFNGSTNYDAVILYVEIDGPGSVGVNDGTTKRSPEIDIHHQANGSFPWAYTHEDVILYGVTADTKVTLRTNKNGSETGYFRWYLDNIKFEKHSVVIP